MRDVILTSVLTILGGVLIFVTGQIFLKFFIDPIHQLRAHIGRITHSLIFYANVCGNPGSLSIDVEKKASEDLRKLASELMSKTAVIPCYSFWSFLKVVRRLNDIRTAHKNLIGLSNGVFDKNALKDNNKRVEQIKAALRLPKEILQ